MRTITTRSGTSIELDGDVLAVVEAISLDLTRRRELDYSFEEVEQELQHVVAQLTADELQTYLKESLFMSFNRYENDRLRDMLARVSRVQDGGREDRDR